jgi:hypothetical protein
MTATAEAILATLRIVDGERRRRADDAGLTHRVAGVKAFQQLRFSHTYADLLGTARYGAATRFFLEELYGPADFTRRDTQFARVVPSMVRLFPQAVVDTVAALADLHALSETLDTAMASHLSDIPVVPLQYVRAWQETGRSEDRQIQITLTLNVAARLDRLTHKPLLRNSLRLMRGSARAAGLAELQQFLEAGFDTFRAMKGAEEFMGIVQTREQALASALFDADLGEPMAMAGMEKVLAHLPVVADDPPVQRAGGRVPL